MELFKVIESLENQEIPCPLCETPLNIRLTEKDGEGEPTLKSKPYIVCQDCGVQMFVRYPKGIHRLSDKLDSWL